MQKSANGPIPVDTRLDKRVSQYLEIRDEMNKIEAHLAKLGKCKEALSGHLQAFLDENKLKSVRTSTGVLVTSILKQTAKLEDPEAFMNFVKDNGEYELLDRRANANACQEYAEAHGNLPPGVKINKRRIVGVTQP